MRFPAKAFPCLLLCVACVMVAPTSALAHPRTASLLPVPHAIQQTPTSGVQHVLRFHAGHQFARSRIKARHVAPTLSASSPHDSNNRFLMTQNGRQMTADDFEAWMKARGIRVAKGVPEAPKAAD
jgi:hypothetical protein